MKYKVAIDLTYEGLEENLSIVESQFFDTEEEADSWYRKLTYIISRSDVIMLIYDDDKKTLKDTYLI